MFDKLELAPGFALRMGTANMSYDKWKTLMSEFRNQHYTVNVTKT